jgi:LPXTG-motif cell wall-anchored protein
MTLSQTAWAAKSTDSPGKGNPPGNNGTIKINGVPLQGGPRNEPHVPCAFNLKFSGYDQGDLQATVSFDLQAPTRRDSGTQNLLEDTIAIGEDPAGGANDLDASRQYNLDFTGMTPHPKQGYHVKATIHADGSQGADVKHKVFWVSPCPATTEPSVTTTTTLAPTTTATQAPKVEGVNVTTTTTTTPTAVLGEVLTKPAVLPRTGGSQSTDLAFLGGLVLALGGALTLVGDTTKRRAARQAA